MDVRWQGPDQLLIQKEINTSVEYKVRVNSVEESKDKVIVSLEEEDNGKRVDIYVNHEFFPWPPVASFRVIMTNACIIFLAVFWVIKAVNSSYEPNQTEQPRSCITDRETVTFARLMTHPSYSKEAS